MKLVKSIKHFLFFLIVACTGFSADLTVDTTTTLNPGTYAYDTVIVNSTLTCKGDTITNTGVIINCYNFIVNSTGKVTADGQGYPQGLGPGVPSSATHGGGYGGHGGGATDSGAGYGSIIAPVNLGSGSGVGGGGPGGGAISIFAQNEVKVNPGGTISSNGISNNWPWSGGSGGSVYIRTKILSGDGEITAYGGSLGGANGGGGRIAIYYESITLNIDRLSARRGTYSFLPEASPGTIYLKQTNQTNGDLIIDGKNYTTGHSTQGNYTPIKGNLTFDTIWIKNLGNCQIETSASVNVTNLKTNSNSNILRVDGEINKDMDLIVPENFILETNSPQRFKNFTIKSNGVVSHTGHYSDTQLLNKMIIEILNNMTIDAGGKIDVTARGYPANAGPGKPVFGNAGGSYGGKGIGQTAGDTPGNTYGSETAPIDLGSGGKNERGGGAIYLLVWETLKIDGSILAEGYLQPSWGYYLGSGGSVYIRTPNFTGNSSGKISVKGGGGGEVPGGGGRVAVYYSTYNYNGIFDTAGGAGFVGTAQSGTKYSSQMSFYRPPRITSIDNPAYSSPVPGKRPMFKWTAPTDQENDKLHFEIEISQDSTFTTTSAVTATSNNSTIGFQHSADNGIVWQDFPSDGVSSNNNPAIRISYTVQQDLWTGNWYYRVRAKDVDGNGYWSDTGLLPSIIGDLVVKITSPSDSTATYDSKIKVEGTIEQSVFAKVNISGTDYELILTDNKFSVEVDLIIGKNTVVVTGTGQIGNSLSDTVNIYRMKIPESNTEGKIGNTGGTVRLEDWDGDPENDARVEIGEGVFEKQVKITIQKIEGDYPVYEIKADGNTSYKLRKKVKLVLNYKNMKVKETEEDKLRIFFWDTVKWQAVGGEVNKTKKIVSCWINHLSKYSVMLMPVIKDIDVSVAPEMFTPNKDGINDAVIFNVMLKNADKFEIKIYDETGKTVRLITEEGITGGISTSWDGLDSNGKLLETGVYFYNVIVSEKIVSSGTVVMVK